MFNLVLMFRFVVVVVFILFVQKHIICHQILQFLAMFNYLVYLTYRKICDRLQMYKETDLASLNTCILFHWLS